MRRKGPCGGGLRQIRSSPAAIQIWLYETQCCYFSFDHFKEVRQSCCQHFLARNFSCQPTSCHQKLEFEISEKFNLRSQCGRGTNFADWILIVATRSILVVNIFSTTSQNLKHFTLTSYQEVFSTQSNFHNINTLLRRRTIKWWGMIEIALPNILPGQKPFYLGLYLRKILRALLTISPEKLQQ